jgi:Fe-S oxidoreductase
LIPTREEFMFFSLPEKLLFYALIYISIGVLIAQVLVRVKLWKTGRPIEGGGGKWSTPRREDLKKWSQNIAVYVLAQKKVRGSRKKSGAPMHLALFYGFATLVLATTLLGINTYSPFKFHKGLYFLIYEEITDWMGLVFIVAVIWAFVRRYRMSQGSLGAAALHEKPTTPGGEAELPRQAEQNRRRPQTSAPPDYWTLALLLALGVTGFWVEATRISVAPKPWDWTDPIGGAWGHLQGDWSTLPSRVYIYKSIWWFHAALVMLFFCVLPRMRIRHILMAFGAAAGKPDRPMGHLRFIPMEEVERTEQIGVKTASDYSRWHLMSLDACMECGRCTEVCPAWNVGKILNPKQIVQDIRGALGKEDEVASRVSEEALWACTTCNACVEACPVLIRHVDLIVDARRNLVSEGRLSGPAATMLRQTASTGNAWGSPASNREDWMKGLDIPLCRNGVEFDYLFWVGCAGATDPGAVKTTKAVAQLLKQAGVRFACLGAEESCTGDPARRIGEEFLFQEKAAQNVSVFERYGVTRVITPCPHCFNTLKNEYGDAGRKLEVVHHSQILGDLIDKGTLVAAKPERGSVVLHDPCYLGRVNEVVDAPRTALGGQAVDPPHSGVKTLCCGAGGGRMWMDEAPDQRPGNRRAEELAETGAETVAVACPFCRIMLGDSIKQLNSKREMDVVDLAELVLRANTKPQAASVDSSS